MKKNGCFFALSIFVNKPPIIVYKTMHNFQFDKKLSN